MAVTKCLGKSGVHVPPLGIGTASWGYKLLGYGKQYTEADLYSAYVTCLDNSFNFFDTSANYAAGDSERLLNKFQKRDGRPIKIATKFDRPRRGLLKHGEKFKPVQMLDELDASLERLGTDKVELYQLHYPPQDNEFDHYMEQLSLAVKTKRARAVGVSNFNPALMKRAYEQLQKYGVPLASNQVAYNLLMRYPEENDLLDLCHKLEVTLIAYTPMANGLLTGKFRHGARKPSWQQSIYFRINEWDLFKEGREKTPRMKRLIQTPRALRYKKLEPMFLVMEEIARSREKTIAQVALNWLLARDPCVLPIPGAKNKKQAEQNSKAVGWTLSKEEFSLISEVEKQTR